MHPHLLDGDASKAVLGVFADLGMPLMLRGKVTSKIGIFDRKTAFIDSLLDFVRPLLTNLRVVIEHVTCKEDVGSVKSAESGLAATLTTHHFGLNRNALLARAIRPSEINIGAYRAVLFDLNYPVH